MKFEILVDGRLRQEVEISEGRWVIRIPQDGVTLTYNTGTGLSMETKSMSRVEIKMVLEEETKHSNGDGIHINGDRFAHCRTSSDHT